MRKLRHRKTVAAITALLLLFSFATGATGHSGPAAVSGATPDTGGSREEADTTAPLTLRVGAYDNPPKISTDASGDVSGFWPDLLNSIASAEGWQLQYVPGSWQESIDRLKAGEVDLMPDVAYTPDRARGMDFCEASVLLSWTRLYVRRGVDWFQSIEDLEGRTVAVLRGSVNLEGPAGLREIADAFQLTVHYLELENYDAVFRAIESGQADAGISNRNFGDLNAGRFAISQTSFVFQPVSLKFAVSRQRVDSALIRARLDAELADLKRDPNSLYYDLLGQYFETEIAEREVRVWPDWVTRTLQILALLLVFLFGAVVYTRVQIKRRTRELRETVVALGERERRYLEIFNSPTDAIFIHEANTGKILEINDPALEMFGVTRESMIGRTVETFSSGEPPYSVVEAMAHIQRARQEGPQVFDWRSRHSDGHLFWTEVALQVTHILDQECILAVARDVDARRTANAALAAEQERLAVTLRSIGDAVITTDIEGRIGLLNRVAEELTGWTAAEAHGLPLHEVFTIVDGASDRPRTDPVRRVLADNDIIALPSDTFLYTKDGRRRQIADSGAPIRDAESRIIGVVLVFRDITEQARQEAEVLKVRKLESVGVLAGGIAHDFNNILAGILGNLELSLIELGPEGPATPLLREAEGAVHRAEKLTKQLLTFARGGEPIKEAASLADIIRESAGFVLRGSNVACRYDLPDELWLVHSDPGQISQVVQNLVLNARHAMPDGGIIDITCRNLTGPDAPRLPGLDPTDCVVMTIRDNGVGIPSKIIERIFDPYFSTKQDGGGLGLAVTHSIIVKHGGQILVDSHPGQGTTFTVYLPALRQAAPSDSKDPTPVKGNFHGRALVMDDEESVRTTTSRMLGRMGFTVVSVASGADAVAVVQEASKSHQGFEVIVLDLTVPGGVGGLETSRRILEISPQAKIIVASGYSNDRVMANYAEYGFSGVLCKPFVMKDLYRVMESIGL